MQPPKLDAFKFDDDDDEEDEPQLYFHDPYDAESMLFRAKLFPPQPSQAQIQARRAQMEAQAASQASARSSQPSIPD